jgi:tetratricopeptide (TPR) repeat protein
MVRVAGHPSRVDRGVIAAAALYQRARTAAVDHGPAQAARLLKRALRALDHAGGPSAEGFTLRARVLISLASAEAETTSLAAGLARLTTAKATLAQLPGGGERTDLAAVVELQRAVVLFRVGRLTESLALFDSTLPRLEQDTEDRRLLFTTNLMNRAYVHLRLSNPEAALTDLSRCLELAISNGNRRLEAKVRHNLGDRALLVGDIPGALRHYDEAARIFSSAGPGSLPLVRVDQARALLAAGLGEEAARHLDEALPRLREKRLIQDVAEAEVARAAAASLQGEFDLAREFAGAARRRFLRVATKDGPRSPRWPSCARTPRRRFTVPAPRRSDCRKNSWRMPGGWPTSGFGTRPRSPACSPSGCNFGAVRSIRRRRCPRRCRNHGGPHPSTTSCCCGCAARNSRWPEEGRVPRWRRPGPGSPS